MEKVLQGETD